MPRIHYAAGGNERWTYTSGNHLMVYGTKCLDAYGQGLSTGTAVVIWDGNCWTNLPWNVNANRTTIDVQSGLCLDANGAGTTNRTKIILWAGIGAQTSNGRCATDPPLGSGRLPTA